MIISMSTVQSTLIVFVITDVTVTMAKMKLEKLVVLLNVSQLRLSTTEVPGMDAAAITSLTASNSFPVAMTSMALPPTSTLVIPTGPLSECQTADGHILLRVFQVQIVSPSLVVSQLILVQLVLQLITLSSVGHPMVSLLELHSK